MPPDLRAPLLLGAAGAALALATVLALAWASPGGCAPAARSILVTGFGPFGAVATNPAWESIRALDGACVGDAVVRTAALTVAYDDAPGELRRAIQSANPCVVLCLGVAPDDHIRLETVARNRDTAPVPDVRGVTRAGGAIRQGGPDLLPTRLPVAALEARLRAEGYPVRTSDDAGGYLCNHVFYRIVDEVPESVPVGFVHVPVMEGPWDLPRLERAVRAMLEVLAALPPPAPGSQRENAPR